MAQIIQTPTVKSQFMALALSVSFATASAITSADSCPKEASKDYFTEQRMVPGASSDAGKQPSTKKRAFEKNKFLHPNKPRWT